MLVAATCWERTMEDQESFPVQLLVRNNTFATGVWFFPYYYLMLSDLNKIPHTMLYTEQLKTLLCWWMCKNGSISSYYLLRSWKQDLFYSDGYSDLSFHCSWMLAQKQYFSKANKNHTCFISKRFFPMLDNSYEDGCTVWSKTFTLDIAVIKGDHGTMMCATLHLKLSLWCFSYSNNCARVFGPL